MTIPAAAPSSALFDTFAGLPLHPLIVHVAVVILPLSALALIVLIVVPRWRKNFGWLTMAGLFVGLVGAVAAKESGEALARRIGLPPDHARLGDILPLFAFALFTLGLAWFVLDRRARARGESPAWVTILGVVAAIVAVVTIVMTVLVGHSGAKAAWAWRITSSSAPAATPTPSSSASASVSGTAAAAPLSLADVQAHGSPDDCWAAVNGNVYDLTDWISRHPGGSGVIEAMCGTDGTDAFVTQHGGQGRPESELEQFLVGPLKSASAAGGSATVTLASYVSEARAAAPAVAPAGKRITRKQVRTHNSEASCWSIINRKVYDLTDWINRHPGGSSRILAICGKDGSAAYNAQHGGQSTPASYLRGFKIGRLK